MSASPLATIAGVEVTVSCAITVQIFGATMADRACRLSRALCVFACRASTHQPIVQRLLRERLARAPPALFAPLARQARSPQVCRVNAQTAPPVGSPAVPGQQHVPIAV